MTSPLPARVLTSPHVLIQPLSGEALVLDLRSELYHRMDDIALRIWQLCESQADLETVVGLLLEEYEIDEQTLRRDLANLLAQWTEAGLVTMET